MNTATTPKVIMTSCGPHAMEDGGIGSWGQKHRLQMTCNGRIVKVVDVGEALLNVDYEETIMKEWVYFLHEHVTTDELS